MNFLPTPIPGVFVVETSVVRDHRGKFYRAYCDQQLSEVYSGRSIRQINVSRTESPGAIRGLHLQLPPQAEMKGVRCLRGRVWDVAVDLRAQSPTFLGWYAHELSAQNNSMLVIPEGCAHGFQVLEEGSELLYLHTAAYSKDSEVGVRHDDPRLGISWPLPVCDLSDRDRNHPLLADDFSGFRL